MTERVFAVAGDWAVGADEIQWILFRRAAADRGESVADFCEGAVLRALAEAGEQPAKPAEDGAILK